MDKNLLIAVTLSIGVYAAWFGFIEKRFVVPPQASRLAPATSKPSGAEAGGRALAAPSGPGVGASSEASRPDRRTLESQAERLMLGTAETRVHPQGAAIVSWRYPDSQGTVELIEDPLPGFLATWPELAFRREPGPPGSVAYAATRPDGLKIRKEFLAGAQGRLPRLRITLSNPTKSALESGAWTLALGPGLGTIESEKEENPKVWRALGLRSGERGLKGKIEAFKPGPHSGDYRWVGVDNRYFLAALVDPPQGFTVTSALPPRLTLAAPGGLLEPQASRTWEFPYYLGAKGQTWLERYQRGLERSIDFGFFAQVGRFVLKVLDRLHSWTGNWGWSIILLTVLLQAVLFPLTYKSLKATAAMKRLQPEMARLQQKHGKDPTKLNAEMMELYKKEGANPLGGCLPMLLQMPIFIALFNALRNAWELHGAPWILWIRDLSAKDPYYVLPLIMGGLMFAQNKLNPPSTDPMQNKMMTWMPVIFTFMFLNFPSGLVLYWLTSSCLSMAQMLALKNRFEGGRH